MFLPNIMKTGVEFVDEGSGIDTFHAFRKMTTEPFIFDFDYAFFNDPENKSITSLDGLTYSKSIPSLLFSFAIAENSIL